MRQASWSDRDAPRAGPQPRVPPADIKTLGSSVVSTDAHRTAAAAQGPIPVGLVTVSDTRTPETDENGLWLRGQVEGGGNVVSGYHVVRDEPDEVRAAVDALVADARVVLVNGGTGVSGRDTTYDTLAALLEKTLPGFGELFRMLSFEQVGAAAMLSRATAGTYRGAVVVSMPGSPKAVRLAWEKLLGPELAHLAWEVGR
jgi:molybdenum cofactor biosynthesis protein B